MGHVLGKLEDMVVPFVGACNNKKKKILFST